MKNRKIILFGLTAISIMGAISLHGYTSWQTSMEKAYLHGVDMLMNDPEQGMALITQAADAGIPEAFVTLGDISRMQAENMEQLSIVYGLYKKGNANQALMKDRMTTFAAEVSAYRDGKISLPILSYTHGSEYTVEHIRKFEEQAEASCPEAQLALGLIYWQGLYGIEKNIRKAFDYLHWFNAFPYIEGKLVLLEFAKQNPEFNHLIYVDRINFYLQENMTTKDRTELYKNGNSLPFITAKNGEKL